MFKSYPRIHAAVDNPFTVNTLDTLNGLDMPTAENPVQLEGNVIENSPRGEVFAMVTNNDTEALTLTAVTTKTISEGAGQLAVADVEYEIAAGDTMIIGPWSANFESSGNVTLNWTIDGADGDVDVIAFRMRAS